MLVLFDSDSFSAQFLMATRPTVELDPLRRNAMRAAKAVMLDEANPAQFADSKFPPCPLCPKHGRSLLLSTQCPCVIFGCCGTVSCGFCVEDLVRTTMRTRGATLICPFCQESLFSMTNFAPGLERLQSGQHLGPMYDSINGARPEPVPEPPFASEEESATRSSSLSDEFQ